MAAGDEEKAVWGAAHYRVLFILYLSYFANVFGRTAVQVSFPVLQAGFGLTHTMTASLLSAGAISQVFGKLINASIIAKLGSSASFVLNLGLQIISYAIMTVPLGGAFSYPRFMVGWVLQMWGASSMWPMMTSLCSDAFQGNGFGRALGILATSSRAGAIFGNMIFGPLSARVSWQRLIHLSMITAGVALVAFKACLFPLPAPPAAAAATAAAPEPAKDAGAKAVVPYSEAIKAFVTSPRVFLVFFCQTMMTMGMECQALLPLYLQQGAGLTAAAAGSMAAVFPLGAAAATLATGAVFDKMRGVKRMALFGAENFIAVGALGMLAGSPATPSAAVLVAIMVGVAPTFYIPSADFVTRFAGPDYKGTLMSYMDIPGQLANIGFMSIYPMLLERGGWGLVFRALQVTILAGAGAMATFLLMDAKVRSFFVIAALNHSRQRLFEATRFALQSPTRVFSDGRKEKAVAPKPAADDEAFSGVTAVPPDPVFFVSQQYKECTAKIKMNLGVGAYRTNEGKPLVLDVVKKAEKAVTAKLVDNSFNGPPKTPLSKS